MKRLFVVLVLFICVVVPAHAHEQPSRLDNRNPDMRIDLKKAFLTHDADYLYGTVRTYGATPNHLLRRGAIRLFLWRDNFRKRHYFVHVHYSWKLEAPIFRAVAGSDRAVRVGSARVVREDADQISLRVSRRSVEALGGRLKWAFVAYPDWCGDKWCRGDGIPSRNQHYTHAL